MKKLSLEEKELLRLLKVLTPKEKTWNLTLVKILISKDFEVAAEQGIFPFIGVLLENKNEVPDRVRMTFLLKT